MRKDTKNKFLYLAFCSGLAMICAGIHLQDISLIPLGAFIIFSTVILS